VELLLKGEDVGDGNGKEGGVDEERRPLFGLSA